MHREAGCDVRATGCDGSVTQKCKGYVGGDNAAEWPRKLGCVGASDTDSIA